MTHQTRLLVPIYVATMLLSACLLFLVQPMFARMALPLLGGTPAVWAIAMLFFQAALLGGYAYAHVLKTYVSARVAVFLHLCFMAGGWFFLPVHVQQALAPQGGTGAGLWLVGLMAQSIGNPFFFLSATAPLLQSWFARTTHQNANNPYFLYSASNIGSIGALLLYPFILEPTLGLAMQARLWSYGYGLLMLAIGISGLAMLRSYNKVSAEVHAEQLTNVPFTRKLWWVLMAFVPSALLVAWTNHITTDIASAPFLWLPPLILFLLTFVLVFRDKSLVSLRVARVAQLVSLPICYIVQFELPLNWTVPMIIIGAIFFFATAIICHRQLYEARPAASQLTEFYMLMSIGGVLGGLFVSLLAPLMFSTVAEYPLLMLVGVVTWLGQYQDGRLISLLKQPLLVFSIIGFSALIVGLMAKDAGAQTYLTVHNATDVALVIIGLIFLASRHFAVATLCLVIATISVSIGQNAGRLQLRNYFGEISIVDGTAARPFRIFMHGTTMHGAEAMSEVSADATAPPHALTYYSPQGGMAQSLQLTQERLAQTGRSGTYRIIGLGTGSLACYAKPGEDWAYYEIDPNVTKVARDPGQFTFLSSCTPNMPVIEGDARLTLASGSTEKVDYLLVDAFSSDSIPIHLITTEAMQLYLSRLKDDGLLTMHVSNRYMDLVPVVAANLKAIDPNLQARVLDFAPEKPDVPAERAIVIVISRSAEVIEKFDKTTIAAPMPDAHGIDPWTDDFANLPAAMMRRLSITKY